PTVWVFFGRRKHVARIVHVSRDFDLAVLKIERDGSPFFGLSAADCPPRGTRVRACGFPAATRLPITEGAALEARFQQERVKAAMRAGKPVRVEEHFQRSDFEFDQTTGTVSRPVTEDGGRKWIQHDATIHGGNSGGPLLAEDGTVVGINTLKHKGAAGV